MSAEPISPNAPDADAEAFYRRSLQLLHDADVPYLVGGAYAFVHFTGIARKTKDIDLFIRPADRDAALAAFTREGYEVEITYPHWLAKAWQGKHFIDLIYNLGNGLSPVDDEWLTHAADAIVLDVPVKLCPAEEIAFSKAFVMERDRYDGADVAHLFRAVGPLLDWNRLLQRFGPHWRILLTHLIQFGYIYPSEANRIPGSVMNELLSRLRRELGPDAEVAEEAGKLCRGTLLAGGQYLIDVEQWGYRDARLLPDGTLTEDEIHRWKEACRLIK